MKLAVGSLWFLSLMPTVLQMRRLLKPPDDCRHALTKLVAKDCKKKQGRKYALGGRIQSQCSLAAARLLPHPPMACRAIECRNCEYAGFATSKAGQLGKKLLFMMISCTCQPTTRDFPTANNLTANQILLVLFFGSCLNGNQIYISCRYILTMYEVNHDSLNKYISKLCE